MATMQQRQARSRNLAWIAAGGRVAGPFLGPGFGGAMSPAPLGSGGTGGAGGSNNPNGSGAPGGPGGSGGRGHN